MTGRCFCSELGGLVAACHPLGFVRGLDLRPRELAGMLDGERIISVELMNDDLALDAPIAVLCPGTQTPPVSNSRRPPGCQCRASIRIRDGRRWAREGGDHIRVARGHLGLGRRDERGASGFPVAGKAYFANSVSKQQSVQVVGRALAGLEQEARVGSVAKAFVGSASSAICSGMSWSARSRQVVFIARPRRRRASRAPG